MYRKFLLALACAMISAPAFAQSLRPQCPDGLGRTGSSHQQQCSYLEWNSSRLAPSLWGSSPPSLRPDPRPNPDWNTSSSDAYGYKRPNPQLPPSPPSRLETFPVGPTWNEGPGIKVKGKF